MPEGDTIHRVAERLRPALAGQVVRRFAAPRLQGLRPRQGMRIESVESMGKHLLIRFERGLVLQTHLQMTGSWQLHRTGERWARAPHLARVVIEVDGWVAVCFAAPLVRTYVDDGFTPVDHLGPDLCRADADLDEAVARMGSVARPDTEIAEVLLDQRVAAGIGNVFKSEVLFAARLDPFTPLHEVDDVLRRRLIEIAAAQLRANLGRGPRATVPTGLAVYGRGRLPCVVCGYPVSRRGQGPNRRSTYWCPRCQLRPGVA